MVLQENKCAEESLERCVRSREAVFGVLCPGRMAQSEEELREEGG